MRNLHCFTLGTYLVLLEAFIALGGPESATEQTRPLDELVTEFNAQPVASGNDVTKDELLAALRSGLTDGNISKSKEVVELIHNILRTKKVPSTASLEMTRLADTGGEFVFEVRNIDLRLPAASGGEVSLMVRRKFITSRTLAEEVRRLSRESDRSPDLPGKYRLQDRIDELNARISKSTKPAHSAE